MENWLFYMCQFQNFFALKALFSTPPTLFNQQEGLCTSWYSVQLREVLMKSQPVMELGGTLFPKTSGVQ